MLLGRPEALAIANEDGQGMVGQPLCISRLQPRRPVHDTRRQLALGDFAAQRDQQLRHRRAGLGPTEKVLVREQRRQVAEHVRQDLPVLFLRYELDKREEERRHGQHDAIAGPERVVGDRSVGRRVRFRNGKRQRFRHGPERLPRLGVRLRGGGGR